jgi:predicted lipid-binding transport protein (Tim44 family)
MKTSLMLLVLAFTLGLVSPDADARRFGGGGNLGKQRAAPTQPAQPPAAAPAPTSQPTQAAKAPAAASPAAAAKPSFMQRWGGLLAGLGIGVLLASLFGETLGPIVGMLLAGLLLFGILYVLYRLLTGKKATPPAAAAMPGNRPMAFEGIGSGLQPPAEPAVEAAASLRSRARIEIPGFEVEPFVRVAKTSFIRLQAANDARDLDDIRDYTTPEMYAELSMQLQERGDVAQKTEVVSVEADVIEAVVEDGYEIASVRFWGLVREAPGANPGPFDETWHVRRKHGDRKAPWLIAGIQQNPA